MKFHQKEAERLYDEICQLDPNFQKQKQNWHNLIPLNIFPICFVYNKQFDKFEAPRQSGYDIIKEEITTIESEQNLNLKENTYYIIQFVFDRNYQYRNKCLPPKLVNRRVGFMSSRTPNRFNFIGQSIGKCIQIKQQENKFIYLFTELDLLNNTPIISFQEYKKEYQIKDAKFGWCKDDNLLQFYYDKEQNKETLTIINVNDFIDQMNFIQQYTKIPVKEFIINSLQTKYNLSRSHKIVQRDTSRVLACGQFRIEYIVENQYIKILKIYPSIEKDFVQKCKDFDRDCYAQWEFYQTFQQ